MSAADGMHIGWHEWRLKLEKNINDSLQDERTMLATDVQILQRARRNLEAQSSAIRASVATLTADNAQLRQELEHVGSDAMRKLPTLTAQYTAGEFWHEMHPQRARTRGIVL